MGEVDRATMARRIAVIGDRCDDTAKAIESYNTVQTRHSRDIKELQEFRKQDRRIIDLVEAMAVQSFNVTSLSSRWQRLKWLWTGRTDVRGVVPSQLVKEDQQST